MKTFIKIFLFLFFCTPLRAQQEEAIRHHEISINVNDALEQFIFKSPKPDFNVFSSFPRQLTQFSYRYFFNPKIAIRVGGAFDSQEKKDSTISGSGTLIFLTKDTRQSWTIKLGLQRRFDLSKKIKPYLGFDFLYTEQFNKRFEKCIDFCFGPYESTSILKYKGKGLATNLGIQYFFSSRISVSTEVNMEFIHSSEKFKIDFNYEGVPFEPSDYEDKKSSLSLDFNAPLVLFFNFHF